MLPDCCPVVADSLCCCCRCEQLSSLPAEIGQLRRLRVLFAYRNMLTEVPEELGACTQLEVGYGCCSELLCCCDARCCCPYMLPLFIPTGAKFSQQPAVVAACLSVQSDQTEETQPQPQPHQSCPRLRLQHEGAGMFRGSAGESQAQEVTCDLWFIAWLSDGSCSPLCAGVPPFGLQPPGKPGREHPGSGRAQNPHCGGKQPPLTAKGPVLPHQVTSPL